MDCKYSCLMSWIIGLSQDFVEEKVQLFGNIKDWVFGLSPIHAGFEDESRLATSSQRGFALGSCVKFAVLFGLLKQLQNLCTCHIKNKQCIHINPHAVLSKSVSAA